jgi:hypothetical protein
MIFKYMKALKAGHVTPSARPVVHDQGGPILVRRPPAAAPAPRVLRARQDTTSSYMQLQWHGAARGPSRHTQQGHIVDSAGENNTH